MALAVVSILVIIFLIVTKKKHPVSGTSQCPATQSSKKHSFNTDQIAEIQQILLETIREKSEQFISAVNDGMQAQQDKGRKDLEKSATSESKRLLSAAIPFNIHEAQVKLIAFIDPLCPHCQTFEKLALSTMNQRKDVTFYFIPIGVLGENSEIVSKAIITAAKLSPQKFSTFIKKLVEKYTKLDKAKLAALVKDSGLDAKKFEKELNSDETHNKLAENNNLAKDLKISGVPTVFAVQGNGGFVIVPPTDAKDFGKIIDNIKANKPLTEGFNPANENADET